MHFTISVPSLGLCLLFSPIIFFLSILIVLYLIIKVSVCKVEFEVLTFSWLSIYVYPGPLCYILFSIKK